MLTVVIVPALIVSFSTLCIVCDEHLIPAVEVFIKQFNVPEEVAAVTLVAFGSAAPELMLNTVGALQQNSSLSLPSVLGSAMIAFGLIPACALIFSKHKQLQIELWPLLRETLFYLSGLTLFIRVIADSVTFTYEALAMTSVYFVYVGTVVGIHLYTKLIPRKTSSDDKLGLFHFMNTPDSTNSTSPAHRRDSADMLGIHSEHLKRNPLIDDALRDAGSTTMRLADVDINKVLDRDLEDAEREGTRLLELDEDEALHPDGELFGTATPLGTTMLNELHKELQPLDLEQVADGAWQIGAAPLRCLVSVIVPSLRTAPISDSSSSSSSSTKWGKHMKKDRDEDDRRFFSDDDDDDDDVNDRDSRENTNDGDIEARGVGRHRLSTPRNNSSGKNNGSPSSPSAHLEYVPLHRVILILVICIICIGCLASWIIILCTDLAAVLGIDQSTLGATLVALGAEIPDTISAVALSRNGFTHGAIAGAIGSQVINISLGIGLPALVMCATGKGRIDLAKDDLNSLGLLVTLVFTVIGSFMMVTIPVRKMISGCVFPKYCYMSRCNAIFLFLIWFCTFCTFIIMN